MATRTVLLGLLGVLVVTVVPGHAAPAKACRLVTDAAGDTFVVRAQESPLPRVYGPQEDSLDILSADVATNTKHVTVVIRVANLRAAAASAPTGTGYEFAFTTSTGGDIQLYFRALAPAGSAPTFDVGTKAAAVVTSLYTTLRTATGVIDKNKNEVRITAPVTAFAAVGGLKPGVLITPGDVTSVRTVAGRTGLADVAVGTKPYRAGTPSCVLVGK